MILRVEKEPEDNVTVIKQKSSNGHSKKQITSLQGLRGISILFVLLYHIRDDTFKVGYLGVDVFFLISGYLMCMLMSRHAVLNWSRVIDFYFRRLKRIVPVYLFIICVVLVSAIFIWLYPLDYESLAEESIKPLLFAANIPDDSEANYFSDGGYHFFHHLWSLSLEIQFYVFVPLIIFILGKFSLLKRIPIVILIGAVSFYFQLQSTKNQEHMALESRIWQFMCGFLAHYLSESRFLELNYWDYWNYWNEKNLCSRFLSFMEKVVNLIATIAIIILVSVPIYQKPTTRLILLSLTTFIVAKPTYNLILCNSWLVNLGDISYSIYMVHWPIFECHKYWNISSYSFEQKVSYFTGFILISIAIVFGYVIEKSYARLSNYIKSWKSLILITFILYLCIFTSIDYLKTNAEDEEKILSNLPKQLKDKHYVESFLLKIWENRNRSREKELENKSMSIGLNQVFKEMAWKLWMCDDRRLKSVPTKYNIDKMHITATCHLEGYGSKNILLLGNSHARTMFNGVEYHFRDIYKHFTLLGDHQCSMIRLNEKKKYFTKKKYAECQLFIKDLIKMLEQWDHQIDVIVVGHAYIYATDPQISTKNLNEDPIYNELQTLYSSLGKIAKDVVFVPVGHYETGVSPHLKILQRRILYNQSLEMFRTPIEYNRHFCPNLKQRIRQINCSNCILMEWEDLYCKNDSCNTIDFNRKLSYFSDANHHNAYGAMLVGEFIRNLYNKWLSQQMNNSPNLSNTTFNQKLDVLASKLNSTN